MCLFFVTQYNSSLSSFVPNFRILTQVVAENSRTEIKVYRQTIAEKSLIEKKITETKKQPNKITEKAKNIYPLYTSFQGYNDHIIIPHDVFYQNYTNGSTPLNKGTARALDKKCILEDFEMHHHIFALFLQTVYAIEKLLAVLMCNPELVCISR